MIYLRQRYCCRKESHSCRDQPHCHNFISLQKHLSGTRDGLLYFNSMRWRDRVWTGHGGSCGWSSTESPSDSPGTKESSALCEHRPEFPQAFKGWVQVWNAELQSDHLIQSWLSPPTPKQHKAARPYQHTSQPRTWSSRQPLVKRVTTYAGPAVSRCWGDAKATTHVVTGTQNQHTVPLVLPSSYAIMQQGLAEKHKIHHLFASQ